MGGTVISRGLLRRIGENGELTFTKGGATHIIMASEPVRIELLNIPAGTVQQVGSLDLGGLASETPNRTRGISNVYEA